MFAGFDLNVDLNSYASYVPYGRELHNKNKRIVKSRLDSFKGEDDKLIAERIVAEWFPSVDADIFLSHSHKDEDGIIGLSGWLHEKFGVSCFIDSCIWGYSEELLQMIDSEYCYNHATGYYNYHERNRSTSHVHMMLSTALSKTLDSCESVFFVNTPNSILPDQFIKGQTATESPWIFSEIAMTKLLRQKSLHQHRRMITEAMDSTGLESIEKSLKIQYDVDLSHLTQLGKQDLDAWAKLQDEQPMKSSLDHLYNIKLKGPFYG